MSPPPLTASYAARIAFVIELAGQLHAYGTTAQRLEGAIVSVAGRLGIECEPWCNPTGMILTFSDPARPPGESDISRVIRIPPGDIHLARLCAADQIAEDVVAGRLNLADGYAALRALERRAGRAGRAGEALHTLAFGLAGAGVAGLMCLSWVDIGIAGSIGLLVGVVDRFAQRWPRLKEAGNAVAAALAVLVAVLVAAFIAPLNLNTVIIASLIPLMPGMSLTNALSELSAQHLVAGTARLFGAMSTLLKLTIGVMVALSITQLLGIEPQVHDGRPQPDWVEWAAVPCAALGFAVLFRAAGRDYLRVMLAAGLGYCIARVAGMAWGNSAGVFLSALTATLIGNGYARWWNRPGAIFRVPGIIMLVPGSISLRSVLSTVQQHDIQAGQETAMLVLMTLLALIAGLMLGNLILPARRNL